MELTKEMMKEIKEKRQWLSDSDSLFLCLLIEKVERYEKALEEIAEETGTPYADIAEKALRGED